MVVTKDLLSAGSTQWAQGGIAAALGPGDTPEQHLHDTLVAGAGLCDEAAVRTLVTEGPDAVRELIALGTQFDHTAAGELSLTREGGHLRDRIAHAGGDATGAEIQRALVAAVKAAPDIEVTEHALVLDLVPGADGGVAGVTLHVMGEGQRDGVGAVLCRAVVLASGGMGQVYSATTNPSVSTGDGMALALRAGAVLRDLEFVQFHPTVMWLGAESKGQQPLISEAVRGEGAFLVDHDGVRFMQGQHDLADLAPRDVVAKAIMRRMRETGTEHMWLDARHFGAEKWQQRFPTILATCRSYGVDPVTDLIPVAPACHYASGGVATDLHGQSSIPGLFACGEVACSGVHGANRLASNSLLEGLVFSRRIAARLAEGLPPRQQPVEDLRPAGLLPGEARGRIQSVMTERAGVLRSEAGLVDGVAAPRRGGRRDGGRGRRTGAGRPPTCSRSAGRSSRPRCCARRPAGRTGARTTPSATTPAGPGTSTSPSSTACPCSPPRPAASPRPQESPRERPHRLHRRPGTAARRARGRRPRPAGGLRRRRGRRRGGPPR